MKRGIQETAGMVFHMKPVPNIPLRPVHEEGLPFQSPDQSWTGPR